MGKGMTAKKAKGKNKRITLTQAQAQAKADELYWKILRMFLPNSSGEGLLQSV